MSRRVRWLSGLLAVLAGGAWLLHGPSAGRGPTPAAGSYAPASAPTMVGRGAAEAGGRPSGRPGPTEPAPEPAPAPPAEMVRFRLEAPGLGAAELSRAQLYLVRKGMLGQERRHPDYEYALEGRPDCFDIARAALRDHHVGTDVPGMRTTWFDGDTVGDRREIVLACEPAPRTELVVRGIPPERVRDVVVIARSLPAPGRALRRLPAPGTLRSIPRFQHRLDEQGRLVRRWCTRASVGLRVLLGGYAADPVELDAGNRGGRFEVVLRPSARLVVVPRGVPGSGYFRMGVRRREPPHEVEYDLARSHEEAHADGYRQVVRDDLGPGTYVVSLEADHFHPREVEVEITRPGEQLRIEPVLEPAVPLGALAIQALLPAGLVVKDPKHVGLFFFEMRRQGTQAWTVMGLDPQEDWRRQRLVLRRVPAGTYELLLWETQADHVAFVRDVVVRAGATTRLQVPLAVGRSFPLRPLADAGLVADERESIGLSLRSPTLGHLPLYMHGLVGEDMIERCGGFEDVSVGPFPVERVFASWDRDDGRAEIELPPR